MVVGTALGWSAWPTGHIWHTPPFARPHRGIAGDLELAQRGSHVLVAGSGDRTPLGKPIASPAVFEQIGNRFRRAMASLSKRVVRAGWCLSRLMAHSTAWRCV